MNHEPPLSDAGVESENLDVLAPGVLGYAVEADGMIYIPVIVAEREGSGDVGRFLDSLSPRCAIPCVISERLLGMLDRRGWVPSQEFDENVGEEVLVYRRPA